MQKFFIKHRNIIEAIAMAIILFSWAWDNQSVKYWDKAITEIRGNQKSIIISGGVLEAIGKIQLQAALTRQVVNSSYYDNGVGVDDIYVEAWKSLEVRQSWHKSISSTYTAFSVVAHSLEYNNSVYKLGVDEDIAFINSALKRIWDVLYPEDGSDSQLIIKPESHSLAKSLVGLNSSLAKKLNSTSARALAVCYEKQNNSSIWYFWIFIFGSFLLVMVKLTPNKSQNIHENKKPNK